MQYFMPFNSWLNIQYEISVSKFNGNYHASLNNSSKLLPHLTRYVVHLATEVEYISARLCLSVCSAVWSACRILQCQRGNASSNLWNCKSHTLLYSGVCKMRHSIFLLSQYVLYNNFSSQIALVVHCFYVVDIYCRQIYRLPLIHTSIYWERKKCPLPLMVRYERHLYKYISMVTLMMCHLIFFYMHYTENCSMKYTVLRKNIENLQVIFSARKNDMQIKSHEIRSLF